MIKVVMVRLDGTAADDLRFAAVERIATLFGSHVIGLLLNPLPEIIPVDDAGGAQFWARLAELARQAGDRAQSSIEQRLARLGTSTEIRRFDIFPNEFGDTAARQAREADVFVTLRIEEGSDGRGEREDLVESVLFGSGRHLFLVAGNTASSEGFAHALIAWNGSREATRALAEAMPYLRRCGAATVVVVDPEPPMVEDEALLGEGVVNYLTHHGVKVRLQTFEGGSRDVPSILIAEARDQKADMIVMGGYGHSRLREWLLGGATYRMLRSSPVSLVIAH
jgi:nucleotide-binding universal stress UspA family protein